MKRKGKQKVKENKRLAFSSPGSERLGLGACELMWLMAVQAAARVTVRAAALVSVRAIPPGGVRVDSQTALHKFF